MLLRHLNTKYPKVLPRTSQPHIGQKDLVYSYCDKITFYASSLDTIFHHSFESMLLVVAHSEVACDHDLGA